MRTFRKAIIAIWVFLLLFAVSCAKREGEPAPMPAPAEEPVELENPRIIELAFTPVHSYQIPQVPDDPFWEMRDSHVLSSVSGQREVAVEINRGEETQVFVILREGEKCYDTTLYLEGGPDQVLAETRDVNKDGLQELIVLVDMNTTFKMYYIYAFEGENCVCLLATDNLVFADLDNDGNDELLSVSLGAAPQKVWIYRWGENGFEKADVIENTVNTYADLLQHNGRYYIETGNESEKGYYKYEDGILTEVSLGKL